MSKRFWSTRNLLIALGMGCQIISAMTLVGATQPPDEIVSVGPMLKKMNELPKSHVRDAAMLSLTIEHNAYRSLNRLTRSLARVVGAIGFLLFIVAWDAHREARRSSGEKQAGPSRIPTKNAE